MPLHDDQYYFVLSIENTHWHMESRIQYLQQTRKAVFHETRNIQYLVILDIRGILFCLTKLKGQIAKCWECYKWTCKKLNSFAVFGLKEKQNCRSGYGKRYQLDCVLILMMQLGWLPLVDHGMDCTTNFNFLFLYLQYMTWQNLWHWRLVFDFPLKLKSTGKNWFWFNPLQYQSLHF